MDKLKKLAKDPKMLAYVGGGAVILYLLYRYFSGRSSSATTDTGVPTPDQSGLTAAEQVGSQEAADVTQLQSDLAGIQSQLDAMTAGAITGTPGDTTVPTIATGAKKHRRRGNPGHKTKKPNKPNKPKPDHPKGHQSNRKQGGTGSVAPSHHHKTPGTTATGSIGPVTTKKTKTNKSNPPPKFPGAKKKAKK